LFRFDQIGQLVNGVEMVGLTVGVVLAVSNTGGLAAPATTGAIIGAAQTAVSGSTAAAVAGSAGAGAAAGAITAAACAAAGGASVGAAAGAGVGGAAAAGVSATGVGATGLVTTGVALGPVGWLVLGASDEQPTASACRRYTFDCWKPVIHDTSAELSSGRLLRDIIMDPRVKQVINAAHGSPQPEIILENIWDEKFRIEYVLLPNSQTAAHAVLLSE